MHHPLIAPHSAGDVEEFGSLTTNPFPPLLFEMLENCIITCIIIIISSTSIVKL